MLVTVPTGSRLPISPRRSSARHLLLGQPFATSQPDPSDRRASGASPRRLPHWVRSLPLRAAQQACGRRARARAARLHASGRRPLLCSVWAVSHVGSRSTRSTLICSPLLVLPICALTDLSCVRAQVCLAKHFPAYGESAVYLRRCMRARATRRRCHRAVSSSQQCRAAEPDCPNKSDSHSLVRSHLPRRDWAAPSADSRSCRRRTADGCALRCVRVASRPQHFAHLSRISHHTTSACGAPVTIHGNLL